ncbi:hypothetical protein ABWL39_17110 [Chitinivorax sp. PXF-14]|uniref:hypothetical protein n=1 Tax=Chitinivorax sp. PXF-14 TaxID=3230488 RepID=UPI0034667932
MRQRIARGLSLVGHPLVALPAAIALSAHLHGGAGLWPVLGALALLGALMSAFSAYQVTAGRWRDSDASQPGERRSLHRFLLAILGIACALAFGLTGPSDLSLGLAVSAAIIALASLLSSWLKLSHHTAFAALGTALLWETRPWFIGGLLFVGLVAWSRLVLQRHKLIDVVAGAGAGLMAGAALWAARAA